MSTPPVAAFTNELEVSVDPSGLSTLTATVAPLPTTAPAQFRRSNCADVPLKANRAVWPGRAIATVCGGSPATKLPVAGVDSVTEPAVIELAGGGVKIPE